MFIPRNFTRAYSEAYSGTLVHPLKTKTPMASKIPKSFCSTLSKGSPIPVPPIDKKVTIPSPIEHRKTEHLARLQFAKEDSPRVYLSAALAGDLEMLKYLIEDKLVGINEHNALGESALKLATCAGHIECVEYLLKQGADLHSVDWKGNSPVCGIFNAKCAGKRCSILDLYVKQGLNLNSVLVGKHNLMNCAVDSKDYELMSYLLNCSFDCSVRSPELTPVYVALILKDFEALDMLLRHGAPFIPETELEYVIIAELMDHIDLDQYQTLKRVLPEIDTFFFDITHDRWRQTLVLINELNQKNESLSYENESLKMEVDKYKKLLEIICKKKAETPDASTNGAAE